MAHVAGELLERHPLVGEQGRGAVAGPVAPGAGEGTAASAVTAPQSDPGGSEVGVDEAGTK